MDKQAFPLSCRKALTRVLIAVMVIMAIANTLVFCLFGIPALTEKAWKARMTNYVQKHEAELTAYALQLRETQPEHVLTRYRSWDVSWSGAGEDGGYVVLFTVYSRGIASSSTDAGVYYSPGDEKTDFAWTGWTLTAESEKICDGWYWYKFVT